MIAGDNEQRSALTLMTLCMILFAVPPVITKIVQEDLNTFTIQFLRFTTVALFFPIAFYLITDKSRVSLLDVSKKDLWHFFLVSFFLLGSTLCFYLSFQYISVTRALILSYTFPIMTVIIARIFLHELISVRDMIAGFLTFVGLYVIMNHDSFVGGQLTGDVFALASALLTAGYIVINRYTSLRQIYYKQTFWLFLFGAILLLPFPLFITPVDLTQMISLKTAGLVAALCIFFTLIPYTIFTSSSRHLKASTIGFFLIASQIISVFLSIWVLGERPPVTVILGGFFILGSAIVSAYTFSNLFSFKHYVLAKVRNKVLELFSKREG